MDREGSQGDGLGRALGGRDGGGRDGGVAGVDVTGSGGGRGDARRGAAGTSAARVVGGDSGRNAAGLSGGRLVSARVGRGVVGRAVVGGGGRGGRTRQSTGAAAGETTNDLLANLIEALKEAPDVNFQRWLSNQVDLWSMRKLDWKQDGSDLMDEAEVYYQEAINTHKWGKRHTSRMSCMRLGQKSQSQKLKSNQAIDTVGLKENLLKDLAHQKGFLESVEKKLANEKFVI